MDKAEHIFEKISLKLDTLLNVGKKSLPKFFKSIDDLKTFKITYPKIKRSHPLLIEKMKNVAHARAQLNYFSNKITDTTRVMALKPSKEVKEYSNILSQITETTRTKDKAQYMLDLIKQESQSRLKKFFKIPN